ncbi:MAG: hypothetical protein RLN70_05125, partial [Rhodospirillaceae bacterium]
ASGGIQYDGEGQISGYSLSGKAGTAALISGVVAGGAAAAGGALSGGGKIDSFGKALGNSVLNDAISTPLNVLGEYYKQQTLGAEYSSYSQLARPDLSVLGKYAGVGLSYAAATKIKSMDAGLQAQEQRALDMAERARQEGNNATAASILAGLGYSAGRREELLRSSRFNSVTVDEAAPTYSLETAGGNVGAETMRNPNLDDTTMGQNAATDLVLAWMKEAGLIDTKIGDNYQIIGTMMYDIAKDNGGRVSMADVMEVVADANGGELPQVSSERLTASIRDSRTYHAGVLNNRARPATSVAGLIMEYSGMNPEMTNGPVASNYRFAGEMHNVRVAAAQMKAAQQQQQVAAHASAIRMGRGNPSQFNNQFYEYLTGNSMSSVPVSYTAAESA